MIVIPKGEANAKPAAEIAKAGKINAAQFAEEIATRKKAGEPICTTGTVPPRYFLAVNRAEMSAYCDRLWRKEVAIRSEFNACKEMIDRLPV